MTIDLSKLSLLDRALLHLESAYRIELDTLERHAYQRGLEDLPGDMVREAVDRVIKTERFVPSIAVIRDAVGEILQERRSAPKLGIEDGPIWQMSDEDHAELMRQMAATKAKLFSREMKS